MRRWGKLIWSVVTVAGLFIFKDGLMSYYHRKREITQSAPDLPGSVEVAAGGNKAVLTLADGRTLSLGADSHGILARQGFTQVLQSGEGMIVYRAGKTMPARTGYNTITTPRGGQYSVVLPDGSRAWLNNTSSLRYPVSFDKHERRVELTGEAYFNVVSDAGRPFHIVVGGRNSSSSPAVELEAMGTEFDVTAYSDEDVCKATLLGGNLKLKAGGKELSLQPGQQAAVTSVHALSIVEDADAGQAAAWKNGLFSFHGATLQEIMRQVARWYDVDVFFKDKIDRRFVGSIPRQVNISTLLQILEATGWVHFRLEGHTVTVMQ